MLANGTAVPESVLHDRDQAFEVFRTAYPKASILEGNKRLLKERYDEAKAAAAAVNAARAATNQAKAEIERRRVEVAVAGVALAEGKSADLPSAGPDPEEARIRASMDTHKADYKRAYDRLLGLKAEIETIQRTVELSRLTMQSDFESWLSNCLALAAAETTAQLPRAPGDDAGSALAAPAPTPAPAPAPPSVREGGRGAPVTGDAAADADIAAFYRASEELKRRRAQGAAGLASALADATRSQQAMTAQQLSERSSRGV